VRGDHSVAGTSAAPTSFGQMLQAIRLSRKTPRPVQHGNWAGRLVDAPLSQNELARQAGLTAGEVWRLELDERRPNRATVDRLAEALDLSPIDKDRLLIAAGWWPWSDPETTENALAGVHGDFYSATEVRRATG